jgi:hypothetical protein
VFLPENFGKIQHPVSRFNELGVANSGLLFLKSPLKKKKKMIHCFQIPTVYAQQTKKGWL